MKVLLHGHHANGVVGAFHRGDTGVTSGANWSKDPGVKCIMINISILKLLSDDFETYL